MVATTKEKYRHLKYKWMAITNKKAKAKIIRTKALRTQEEKLR